MGGGASIFDDFWGESNKEEEKKEEVEAKAEDNTLQLDESKILQFVAYDASQKGQALISHIVMTENNEFIDNIEESYKSKIVNTILNDMSHSFSQNIDYPLQVGKANTSIKVLYDNFQIDEKGAKDFIIKQCN
mmetsp:Transcript_30158/g.29464  ORF Transcript_30158/g.29464 Transcript_30158/m.29464 type:complete len:133 (+) Transcript_30158:454-852(+)